MGIFLKNQKSIVLEAEIISNTLEEHMIRKGRQMSLIRSLRSNLIFTLSSQMLSLLLSVFALFVLPTLLSPYSYSVYQLNLLYLMYAGFFHMGYGDGLYLTIPESRMNNSRISAIKTSQIALLIALLCACAAAFFYFEQSLDMKTRAAIIFTIPFVTVFGIISNTMNAAGRVKEFSIHLMSITAFSASSMFVMYLLGVKVPLMYVLALNVPIALYVLIDVARHVGYITLKKAALWYYLKDFLRISSIGLKILAANLIAILSVNSSFLFVKQQFGMIAFGQLALAVSLTMFLNGFLAKASLALYPLMHKRTDREKSKLLSNLSAKLGILVLAYHLLAPSAISFAEGLFLRDFPEAHAYILLLYPLFILESKVNFLIITYLKVSRLEGEVLKISLLIFAVGFSSAMISIYYFSSLDYLVYSIFFTHLVKYLLYNALMKKFHPSFKLNHVLPVLATISLFMSQVIEANGHETYAMVALLLIASIILDMKENIKDG